jgi:hypothetical protein
LDPRRVIALAITFVAEVVSFRFVEQPIPPDGVSS